MDRLRAQFESQLKGGQRKLVDKGLARARTALDRIAIAAYLGGSDVFDRAITHFAAAYADQNERDHQSLVHAVASGRVTAERSV